MSSLRSEKVVEISHIDPSIRINELLSSKWTFVSMLFDIDKYQDGVNFSNSYIGETEYRKFQVYVDELYTKFRELTVPRIIFTNTSVKNKILAKEEEIKQTNLSGNYKIPNIVFIVIEFEDLQAFSFLDTVKNNRLGNPIYDRNRNSAVYNICTISKAEAMLRSIDINPYSSTFFSWLDLGYYKQGHHYITFSHKEMDLELSNIMSNKDWNESKYYVGLITWVNRSIYENINDFYKPGGRCTVTGGFNFGHMDVAKKIYSDFLDIFKNHATLGYGHADEQILFYTCLKNLDIVEFFPSDYFCDIFNCFLPKMNIDCSFNFLIPNLLKDNQSKILNTICDKFIKSHKIGRCILSDKQFKVCYNILNIEQPISLNKEISLLNSIDIKHYKMIFVIIASPGDIYNKFKRILLKFMNSRDDIKTFFIYGNVNKDEIFTSDHDLYYDVEESLIPGIYDKTALALKYIDSKYSYDFIIRTNLSSFFSIDRMLNYISSLPTSGVMTGVIGNYNGTSFVSGAGIIMSRDVSQYFCEKYSIENQYRKTIPDDVAISFVISDKYDITPQSKQSRYDIDYTNPLFLKHDSQIPTYLYHFRLKCVNDRNLDVHNMNYLFNYFHRCNIDKTNKITRYTIFGERNSGTNYLEKIMNSNFDLMFTKDYGHKHWFIKDFEPRGPPNTTTDNECITPLDNDDSDTTLFIFIVRPPISWLKSMHKTPYHYRDSKNLPFSEFIRTPWVSYEPSCPYDHIPGQSNTPWHKNLKHKYPYFIEEADNICQLRNQKNKHFLSLSNKVKHYHLIRQNHLLEDLKAMKDLFDLDLKSDIIELHNYRNPKEPGDISDSDLTFITSSLDKDTESMLGFDL